MLKVYLMPNGLKYQYEEGKAPEGAVLVEKAKKKPRNKAKKVKDK